MKNKAYNNQNMEILGNKINISYCNLTDDPIPNILDGLSDRKQIELDETSRDQVQKSNVKGDILILFFDRSSEIKNIGRYLNIPMLAITNNRDEISSIVEAGFEDYFLVHDDNDVEKKALIKRIHNLKRGYSCCANETIDKNRLPELIERAPDIFIVFSSNMDVKYTNAYADGFDIIPSHIKTSEDVLSQIHEEDRENVKEDFAYLMNNPNKTTRTEFRAKPKDLDEWVWFESIGQNFMKYEGINGIFCLVRDITKRKSKEEELKRQRDRLDNVVDIMSHDLRNLMSVAMSRSEILIDKYDDENAKSIKESLDRMDELISDSVELAEGGKEVEEFENINLNDLFRQCKENVVEKNAQFIYSSNAMIKADKSKLSNLIENLYNNSIEHNNTEDLIIKSGLLENGFFIEDNGKGIQKDERQEVIKSGYKCENSNGSGLGLNIVNEISRAHNWNFKITDSESGGARFEFTNVEIKEFS
jgi:PAS domain S-box-containing protein